MKKKYTLFISRFTLLSLVLACLFALHGFSSAGAAKASGPYSGGCGWQTIASRSPGAQGSYLNNVAALSANDVWTVGTYYTANHPTGRTLTEHWNGTAWSVIASPNAGHGQDASYLASVAGAATKDVWAVGYYSDAQSRTFTLVEHWDGTMWKIVPSANAHSSLNILQSVFVLATNDVWAVGYYNPAASSTSATPNSGGGNLVPLTEHWNGKQWTVISSPGTPNSTLSGVSGSASGDVWAVGITGNTSSQTLTEHWNGKAWSIVNSPSSGQFSELTAVSSLSANNVWAVGTLIDTSGKTHPMTVHWNGKAWQIVSTPNVSGAKNTGKVTPFSGGGPLSLTGVVAISANNVWAAGGFFNSSSNLTQTLTMHWDGKAWSVVTSPNPGSSYNHLQGIASVPGTGTLWTVGSTLNTNSSVTKTLVEWAGGCRPAAGEVGVGGVAGRPDFMADGDCQRASCLSGWGCWPVCGCWRGRRCWGVLAARGALLPDRGEPLA